MYPNSKYHAGNRFSEDEIMRISQETLSKFVAEPREKSKTVAIYHASIYDQEVFSTRESVDDKTFMSQAMWEYYRRHYPDPSKTPLKIASQGI